MCSMDGELLSPRFYEQHADNSTFIVGSRTQLATCRTNSWSLCSFYTQFFTCREVKTTADIARECPRQLFEPVRVSCEINTRGCPRREAARILNRLKFSRSLADNRRVNSTSIRHNKSCTEISSTLSRHTTTSQLATCRGPTRLGVTGAYPTGD